MALPYTIPSNGLQLLYEFLGLKLRSLASQDLDDVIFIAIDFEHLRNIKQDSTQNLDSQISIAILDTKDIVSSPPQNAISTYNFVTGSPSYRVNTTKKFLFGKTVTIHQQDILVRIESLIQRTRNTVLLGHDFKHDLNVLQYLKFDLHTSIVGILDTERIASEMMPNNPTTLCAILEELRSPFEKLHTAGNDAYFTLRTLLLVAIRSYTDRVIDDNKHQDKLIALEAITQVPYQNGRILRERTRRKGKKGYNGGENTKLDHGM